MRNSKSGAPSKFGPTSSRSALRFLSVNGTAQSYGPRPEAVLAERLARLYAARIAQRQPPSAAIASRAAGPRSQVAAGERGHRRRDDHDEIGGCPAAHAPAAVVGTAERAE